MKFSFSDLLNSGKIDDYSDSDEEVFSDVYESDDEDVGDENILASFFEGNDINELLSKNEPYIVLEYPLSVYNGFQHNIRSYVRSNQIIAEITRRSESIIPLLQEVKILIEEGAPYESVVEVIEVIIDNANDVNLEEIKSLDLGDEYYQYIIDTMNKK